MVYETFAKTQKNYDQPLNVIIFGWISEWQIIINYKHFRFELQTPSIPPNWNRVDSITLFRPFSWFQIISGQQLIGTWITTKQWNKPLEEEIIKTLLIIKVEKFSVQFKVRNQ